MNRFGLLALATLGLSGCMVVDPHIHSHGSVDGGGGATLFIDWTINNSKNPAECRRNDAPTVDIVILTPSGHEFDHFQADCEDFATSIVLPPGSYSASVELLDSRGDSRTTFIDTDIFRLFRNDEFEVDLDFPPSSFF